MQFLALFLALAPQAASATIQTQPNGQHGLGGSLQRLGYVNTTENHPTAVAVQARVPGRGYLGVVIDAQGEEGAILAVGSVVDGSPAQGAGLKVGDRLVAINGRKLANHADLIAQLGKLGPGKQVKLDLERSFEFDLPAAADGSDEAPKLGVSLSEGDSLLGVSTLVDGKPAQKAGIKAGDRIVSIDSKAVATVEEVVDHLRQRASGTPVRVRILRTLPIKLGSAPDGAVMPTTSGWLEAAAAAEQSDTEPEERVIEIEVPEWTEAEESVAPDGSKQKTVERRYRLRVPSGNLKIERMDPADIARRSKSTKSGNREVIVVQPDGVHGEDGEIHAELQALRKELEGLRTELKGLRQELKGLRPSPSTR